MTHSLLLGAGTSAPTLLAPSSTSGLPLLSQGSSANPAYIALSVPGGGTGLVTATTAYAPIISGTTATGAFQVASTGLGTAGFVLTSNGSAAIPSFQAASGGSGFSTINIQTFTSNGTYTPTASMKYCIIEVVGGGGGGGGTASALAGYYMPGGGGGGGGYSRKFASAATIGASQTVTIGAAGAAGAAGNNAGGAGGDTSLGAICIGKGGSGGGGNDGSSIGASGAGGIAGTGDFTFPGQPGFIGNFFTSAGGVPPTALGGSSYFGYSGAQAVNVGGNISGGAGQNYGAGGGGGVSYNSGGTQAGADGAKGFVIVTEYI